MPEARSNFDASRLLHDDDCDILDEYNTVLDGALDMRRKISFIVSQARQLQTELLAKQAENDHLTSRHQQELSRLQKSAELVREKLRPQNNRLRQYRDTNRLLRLRNRELANDLEAAREDLDKVNHLRCDICMDSFKNVVVMCGHGFCKGCLTIWLRQPKDGDTDDAREPSCPICRRAVRESDIRQIYLGSDSPASAVLEGDDRATEVLSVDSDSE